MFNFSKKWIFSFIVSFSITFILGFFVWSAFVDFPGNPVKQVLAKINSKLFTASVAPYDEIQPVMQSAAPSGDGASLEEASDEDGEVKPAFAEATAGKQDLLDDIQEKLDIISQQVLLLQKQQQPEEEILDSDEIKNDEEKKDDENKEEILDKNNKIEEGLARVVYLEILILEVQISPIEQRFIKLCNANSQDVGLTGWYIQRKTQGADSWSSAVSSTNFEGKIIKAGGCFIIARQLATADILLPDLTITENNLLALKNPNQEIVDNFETQSVYTAPVGGGGASALTIYPKILISEIQILPIAKRFIELFNPNNYNIDLTGWYLQRKTKSKTAEDSWDSFVSAPNFSGKTIGSNDYFLISKAGSDFSGSSDIFIDASKSFSITADNSFAFKNPNGDISDKLGYGNALDFELLATVSPSSGQSIGRKFLDNTEQDTNNNSADFVIFDIPTPRKQNE